MAAAANRRSFYSGSNPPHPNRFVFSADPPPKISLTPDQFNYCSEALKLFSQKLQMPDEINREFSHLQANRITPSEMMRRCTVGFNGANLDKNRYSDVIPFDTNRVVLNSCKDYRPAAKGYINASFVTTSSSENISKFIATQGPLPHTYEDFWEMVIQCHCPVIVMLTRLVDNYKVLSYIEAEAKHFYSLKVVEHAWFLARRVSLNQRVPPFKYSFVFVLALFLFTIYVQTVKCGDYFQAENVPRQFGNICIDTKWIQETETSLLIRNLEVNYKEV
ncbi:hypothetical protein Goklo_018138 [Gossypium klotzschianum]|uniref:Tyrosine-protein phosphatase domain-containing protein n=1 Tax=Gossypium klotzschianum TaxID=34286 RepID=A0A7J8UJU3_9ROSI|nr:hypothetical protein [Gossypium klotzschianum]